MNTWGPKGALGWLWNRTFHLNFLRKRSPWAAQWSLMTPPPVLLLLTPLLLSTVNNCSQIKGKAKLRHCDDYWLIKTPFVSEKLCMDKRRIWLRWWGCQVCFGIISKVWGWVAQTLFILCFKELTSQRNLTKHYWRQILRRLGCNHFSYVIPQFIANPTSKLIIHKPTGG